MDVYCAQLTALDTLQHRLDLRAARAELAELAVGRERLRISRDLHDLLGHTLSAVSLKGDLALRLLERNEQPRAAAEIESLTAVARSALRDMRDVAQDAHHVSLATEAATCRWPTPALRSTSSSGGRCAKE